MNLNFIFTGGNFTYMYYRAIDTALKTQKYDKATLYYTELPDSKYFDMLKERLSLTLVDKSAYDYATGIKRDDKFYRTHLKDLILWELAYKVGGIFLDLDTISYKDISDLLGDKQLVVSNDAPDDMDVYHRYNGDIIVVREKSKVAKELYRRSMEAAVNPNFVWGDTCPKLLTETVLNNKDSVVIPDYGVLGGFGANHIKYYYDKTMSVPDNCRVLHLCAGSYPQANAPEWDVSAWLKKRGNHYKPMFDYLATHKVTSILEIGTYNGENAIGMIKTSQTREDYILYTGVDLFEKHDQETIDKEVSWGYHNPPTLEEVKEKLEGSTIAHINLFKGDSKKVLSKLPKEVKYDFIYIDGGHSKETIKADWENAQKLLEKDGVVFFDDYFIGRDDIGCKFLESNKFTVHPEMDDYGEYRIKLMSTLPRPAKVKSKYRFHILGLVHLPTSEEYMGCAFTQKNVKLCKMLMDLGHEVYLYASEGSTAPCTKLIETHTLKDIRDSWGEGDNRFEIGYDWHSRQFKHDFNEKVKKPATLKFYQNAITEINLEKRPDDFLIITQGTYQRPVDKGVGLYLTCESGIGYRGSYTNFRSWESSYIQNFTYGSEHPREAINGRYYDRVIPNYFDTKDFPFIGKKKDYFLFMGRMITRKGVFTAIETCEYLGKKLILAGQLSDEISLDTLKKYRNVEFVGYADAKKRAELMGNALAVFTPTIYLEPFCGVHVESMLCGTPVITTNFGVFPDTVIDGVNGFKCDTLNDFVIAAKKVSKLDPRKVRETAERFTLDQVSKQYQKWFDDLHQLYLSAKDPTVKGWHYIDPSN